MANDYITYPLLILVIIAGFTQLLVNTNSTGIDLSYNGSINVDSQTGNLTENENTTTIQTQEQNAVFDINMITGLIALIISLIVVGVIAGIRVLGSGLSEKSVTLIYNSTVYYGLWGIFSALSFQAFNSIPIVGLFTWLIMTLIYSLGFFKTTHGN